MDEMINGALGLGEKSHLRDPVEGVNEPFIECLHALTHGNPISVRFIAFGLQRIFQTDSLLVRAEMELDLFTILVCRRALGEDLQSIWRMLAPLNDHPGQMKANAKIAGLEVKKAGLDKGFPRL